MHYSASRVKQDYGATGILYDLGSVYEGLSRITDKRKARGKLYRLETILMIIVLAKLSGEDKPTGIAEWGKHHGEEIMKLMQLKKSQMPSVNTYRRALAEVASQEEVERMVGTYNQRGEHGEVYGLDGKAVRGMRKKDEEGSEYLLSVYDVKYWKVLAQVEVGRKENEISKAPKALESVEISQKVVTGDAMHTQKALSGQIVRQGGDYIFPVKENQLSLYKNIQQLFAPEYPKAGFGKIETDFQTVEKVNKGHGRLEKRTLTTSEMLNSYSTWPGLAQVYRLERQFQWWRSGRCYRTSCEVEFGITSLSRKKTTPERLLFFRRNHWGIETGLHYRRDVTFKEDATRMTIGNSGKVMASINNLVIALIHQANFQNAAQARRWFAAHLPDAFALLTTPFS
jgi:predicted transposase YbfD/YdcC